MSLDDLKEQLYRCSGCTECYGRGPWIPYTDAVDAIDHWVCPTVKEFKFVTYSGKGQQYLAREVAYGRMELDEEIAKVFYSCTTCGICDEICPRPLLETQKEMRTEIFNRRPDLVPKGTRDADDRIRTTRNFLGGRPEKRGHWTKGLEVPTRGKVMFFAGCHLSYRQPQSARLTVQILRKAGVDVGYFPGEECCGLHPGGDGNQGLLKDLVSNNMRMIQESGAEVVLASCPGCFKTFKMDYPKIAGKLPFRVVHLSELLRDLIREGKLELGGVGDEAFTYHDPCLLGKQHLGRRQALYDAPREVIKSIPNLKFKEMRRNRRWSYCCGGGALVTQSAYPELSRKMSKDRLEEVKEVADAVITTCPLCVANFKQGTKGTSTKTAVYDLQEVMAKALGILSLP
jgi:heterodisulfide reductase subunit D